jgi:excisionase family DNA binding protein
MKVLYDYTVQQHHGNGYNVVDSRAERCEDQGVPDNLYTTSQAADILGVSLRRVQALIKRGQLQAERVGKFYLISKEDLDAFIEARRTNAGRPRRKRKYTKRDA